MAEFDEQVEAGRRVFDVLIDGQTVLEAYDIMQKAGGTPRARVEEFTADVKNGSLSVELRRSEAPGWIRSSAASSLWPKRYRECAGGKRRECTYN